MQRVVLLTAVASALFATGCNELIDIDRFTVGGQQHGDGGMDAGEQIADSGLQDAGATDAGVHRDGGPRDAGNAPPTVVFLSGTVADGATTNTSRVEFSFVASPADPATAFECQLESVTAAGTTSSGFHPCTSPVRRDLLDAGLHTLSIRAQNPGTDFGPPATRQWNLEAFVTDIPTIKQGTRAGTFDIFTLVKVQARVQHVFSSSHFYDDFVAIADAGGATLASVAWHGIFTKARSGSGLPGLQPGRHVTVTGVVSDDESVVLRSATYELGTLGSRYPAYYTRDAGELGLAELDGIVVDVAGDIPSTDCPSGTETPPRCFNTCEGIDHPFPYWTDVTDPYFGRTGIYTGAMYGGALQVFDFQEQNDACL